MKLVGAGGFEPPTLRLSSACSNQLSYAPRWACAQKTGGADEDRTRDLLLAKQALSQLSYGPVMAFPIIMQAKQAPSFTLSKERLVL